MAVSTRKLSGCYSISQGAVRRALALPLAVVQAHKLHSYQYLGISAFFVKASMRIFNMHFNNELGAIMGHRVIPWVLSVVVVTALITLIVLLFDYFTNTPDLPEKVIVAMIGAVAVTITIVGSLLATQLTSAATAKLQRSAEARKIKQEYYNNFLEVLSKKLAYINDQTCEEAIEANHIFCIEVNRLPLYASQEIVEWVNEISKGNENRPNFNKLYSLIRDDLCDDRYEKFDDLPVIHFQIPKLVTKKGLSQPRS